ncbi:MAG TPA: endonuclease/exonuclease/phosphatase family protein [Candidatus Ozemobacteraceae bacterium]|nr:endonuclease/exonuclease/phosphatase family protein [Candidatus Ozemobacteraceae bacterium]
MNFWMRSPVVVGLLLIAASCCAGPFDGRVVLSDSSGSATSDIRLQGVEEHICVGSYNIAHARGNGEGSTKNEIARRENLDGIAAMLKSRKIDICGLVEISKGDLRARFRNQPKYIAENIGEYHYVYGENVSRGFGLLATQGNAFVSRFPILWSKNHKLYRSDPKNEQRSCLEALVDLGNGRKLRVMVAHLSLLAEESTKQLAEMWSLVLKSREPVLLMGDYNSRPGSARIRWLAEKMKDATANVNTTFLQKPDVKIDYIFSYGSIRCGTAFVDGFNQGYSDHGCLINEFWVTYPR